MDCSLPGSSTHEIFQARILEWVVITFSSGSSQPRDRILVFCTAGRFLTIWATREVITSDGLVAESCQTLVTPWNITHQSPFPMGFPRQDYWGRLPFSSPEYLPTNGLNPGFPHCRQILYHLNHQGSLKEQEVHKKASNKILDRSKSHEETISETHNDKVRNKICWEIMFLIFLKNITLSVRLWLALKAGCRKQTRTQRTSIIYMLRKTEKVLHRIHKEIKRRKRSMSKRIRKRKRKGRERGTYWELLSSLIFKSVFKI